MGHCGGRRENEAERRGTRVDFRVATGHFPVVPSRIGTLASSSLWRSSLWRSSLWLSAREEVDEMQPLWAANGAVDSRDRVLDEYDVIKLWRKLL